MDAMRDQRGLPWLDDFVRDVVHAVCGMALLVITGVAFGIPVSLAAAGLVRNQRFGLTPADVTT